MKKLPGNPCLPTQVKKYNKGRVERMSHEGTGVGWRTPGLKVYVKKWTGGQDGVKEE